MTTTDYDAFKAHWRLSGNAPLTAENYIRCVKRLGMAPDDVTYADLTATTATVRDAAPTLGETDTCSRC